MRREAVERFQRFLQWVIDEYAELEEEKGDAEDDDDDGQQAGMVPTTFDGRLRSGHPSTSITDNDANPDNDSNASKPSSEYGECQYSIAKSPAYANVDIITLEKQFGATKFVHALETFLSTAFWSGTTGFLDIRASYI